MLLPDGCANYTEDGLFFATEFTESTEKDSADQSSVTSVFSVAKGQDFSRAEYNTTKHIMGAAQQGVPVDRFARKIARFLIGA